MHAKLMEIHECHSTNVHMTCDATYSIFVADVDVLNCDLKIKNLISIRLVSRRPLRKNMHDSSGLA